ncbi:glycosyl transferase family 2 [Sutcliffiella cohnii]|uniref:glycosyl transferase family 2 n=1 Tax=Sutcliffiella cohnii TaxID=33932 RepID=UPI002E2085D7|nr:glycosyl transferase family 2 [Sutcliffiella cohnii]
MDSLFQHYNLEYVNLDNFELPIGEKPYILQIVKDGIKFEFLIRTKECSKKAIIFGSGAYDATSELSPPIFQRHKWIKHFSENLIYYNDPTLYLGPINIGWGFGYKERHYLSEIGVILKALLKKMNVKEEKALLYGSSAGGFMSLMLAGYFKNAKVLVNNPQTIVWNYYDKHVNAMFKYGYPELSREEIINKYTKRLSILEFYKSINYIPPIYYLQNATSIRDIEAHLNPFLLGLSQFNDESIQTPIKVELYSDKELGHSPLRITESLTYINNVIDTL